MSIQQIKEIVRRMIREHFEIEEGVERIIWFKNGEQKEIHLIEVNRNTIPEGMILTFYHGPTPEYPLPAIVGDITPEEWDKVKKASSLFQRAGHWAMSKFLNGMTFHKARTGNQNRWQNNVVGSISYTSKI